jgi:alkylation response protein AidB-like acyl-CoA dehydrogenase
MALRLWVVESMVYRTARSLTGIDPELAVECSALKVFGSEVLDYVVDEAVQIFGGYGFTSEYPVERYFRDARVYRIFEGTNEINRLLISRMVLKRNIFSASPSSAGRLAGARQGLMFAARLAIEKHGEALKDEQEILLHLADITMEIYAMDSALCRAAKRDSDEMANLMAETFVSDALSRVEAGAIQVVTATCEGDELRSKLNQLRSTVAHTPANTIQNRRRIADVLLDSETP